MVKKLTEEETNIVPMEAPPPVWPEATETRNLRCRVNSEETNILAKEQSEIIQQVARLEDAKKASASEYKARIEEK